MTTTKQMIVHLQEVENNTATKRNLAREFQNSGSKFTSANQTSTINTIKAVETHADDCSICAGYDGS